MGDRGAVFVPPTGTGASLRMLLPTTDSPAVELGGPSNPAFVSVFVHSALGEKKLLGAGCFAQHAEDGASFGSGASLPVVFAIVADEDF